MIRQTRWGNWVWRPDEQVLAFDPNGYEIDLDRCTTCAGLLDWIFQLNSKTWLTAADLQDMLKALEFILQPQATMCSYGEDKVDK